MSHEIEEIDKLHNRIENLHTILNQYSIVLTVRYRDIVKKITEIAEDLKIDTYVLLEHRKDEDIYFRFRHLYLSTSTFLLSRGIELEIMSKSVGNNSSVAQHYSIISKGQKLTEHAEKIKQVKNLITVWIETMKKRIDDRIREIEKLVEENNMANEIMAHKLKSEGND